MAKTLPGSAYAKELTLFLKALVLEIVQVRHKTTRPSGLTMHTNFFFEDFLCKKTLLNYQNLYEIRKYTVLCKK